MEQLLNKRRRLSRATSEKADTTANMRLSSDRLPSTSLSDGASAQWVRLLPVLAELGTASVADIPALELCCEALASERELREVLRVEGLMVKGGSGGMKAHPALKALETTRSQAHRLLADFGLTPKGRENVKRLPSEPKNNPFAHLIKKKTKD